MDDGRSLYEQSFSSQVLLEYADVGAWTADNLLAKVIGTVSAMNEGFLEEANEGLMDVLDIEIVRRIVAKRNPDAVDALYRMSDDEITDRIVRALTTEA